MGRQRRARRNRGPWPERILLRNEHLLPDGEEAGDVVVAPVRPRTLAGKFLVFQLGVVGSGAAGGRPGLRAAVDVPIRLQQRRSRSRGRRECGGQPAGRRPPATSTPRPPWRRSLEAARIQSGATVVLVADVDRQIITSTDPTLIGSTLTLPDESAWTGRSWDGDLTLGDSG